MSFSGDGHLIVSINCKQSGHKFWEHEYLHECISGPSIESCSEELLNLLIVFRLNEGLHRH